MKLKIRFILSCAILLGGLATLIGCADVKAMYEENRAILVEAQGELQKAMDEAKVVIAKLPPDDPVRIAAEENLVKLQEKWDKAGRGIEKIDKALLELSRMPAGENPFNNPAVKEAAGLFGPYGELAVGLLGSAFMIFQYIRGRQSRKSVKAITPAAAPSGA